MQKGIDFIGITTVFFCHDGKGKFLMAKRSKNARDEHGRWDIGGGHSMAWEIVQGKAVIFDAQSRKMYDNPEVLSELADRIKEANYTRLDNIQLDPVMMGRWLKNASTK